MVESYARTDQVERRDGTPPALRAVVTGLLWVHAAVFAVVGIEYLDQSYMAPFAVPFLLGAVCLVIAGMWVQMAPGRVLGWVRDAVGGLLTWFLAYLATPALATVAWNSRVERNNSAGLWLFTALTLTLWLWYTHSAAGFPGIARRGALVVLSLGTAVGLPFAAWWWGGQVIHPLLRLGLTVVCLAGYPACIVAWIEWPRVAARVFPPFVRLTTLAVLLFGVTDTFFRYVIRSGHGEPGFEIENFALLALPVVANAAVMLALAHGQRQPYR